MRADKERVTGFITDERYFWHVSTVDFGPWVEGGLPFEKPEPRRRLLNLIRQSGLAEHLRFIEPTTATSEDIALVHDRDYIQHIQQMSAHNGGEAGEFAGFGAGGYDTAALAVGGVATAMQSVMDGAVDNAYALVRPGGHHAERDRGRGYCIFCNDAVAIRMLQQRGALNKVAVVDFDVHHGNGTEQAFIDDPSVLTISLHQDRYYPEESGQPEDTGTGEGVGTNINIALPPGCGEGAYQRALESIVGPAIRAFHPDLILVAAGYDSGGLDPLGRMQLSAPAFGRITDMLLDLADEVCAGKLVVSHHGGYSELHVPFCGLRVTESLSGHQTDVEDPFAWIDDLPGQELTPWQADLLNAMSRTLIDSGVTLGDATQAH